MRRVVGTATRSPATPPTPGAPRSSRTKRPTSSSPCTASPSSTWACWSARSSTWRSSPTDCASRRRLRVPVRRPAAADHRRRRLTDQSASDQMTVVPRVHNAIRFLFGVDGEWVRDCSYGRRAPGTQRILPAGASMSCARREARLPEAIPDPPAVDSSHGARSTGRRVAAEADAWPSGKRRSRRAGRRWLRGAAPRVVRTTWRYRRALRAGHLEPATVEAIADPLACCHRFESLRRVIELRQHRMTRSLAQRSATCEEQPAMF